MKVLDVQKRRVPNKHYVSARCCPGPGPYTHRTRTLFTPRLRAIPPRHTYTQPFTSGLRAAPLPPPHTHFHIWAQSSTPCAHTHAHPSHLLAGLPCTPLSRQGKV